MGAFDISRNAFNPAKHYSSVRMQQGRVITDDDWNENERIEDEDLRRMLVDVVGPFGSPDDGFKITNLLVSGGFANFDILPGTMYLGGLRLEMDMARYGGTLHFENYTTQRDWLQWGPNSYQVPLAGALTNPRYDIVFLEAWQQGVSAVEDNELFEAALAGPDTSTRMRLVRRVRVAPNIGFSSCFDAWTELRSRYQAQHLGLVNSQMERKVDTTLLVGFTEEGTGDDLCTPAIAGSYLGAENQAIRVQIVDSTHFTWGFDNASPYYRIVAINSTTMELRDLPKDQHHWPLAGENVEILAWSSLLPNGEKVAEQTGHLTKLSGSYDPNTHRIILATPLPGGFNNGWATRPDSSEISNGGADTHLYMRVWNRGTDSLSTASLVIQPGPNVLGNTGLTVTFGGTDRMVGDHWVIAARPETPDEIVPWRLQHEGMSPHGVRYFMAPLGIIRWQLNPSGAVEGAIIHDCRKTFRPLTNIESCCTFHVGDGTNSFGDYNNLELALANLPDEGGKICVLPGIHRANLLLDHRENITICGCSDRSIILPKELQLDQPIIAMTSCHNILIEKLSFAAPQGRAILLGDTDAQSPSVRIIIRHNFFFAVRNAIYIHCHDLSVGDNHIVISRNEIAIPNISSAGVGIFCLADGAVIERNSVIVVPAPEDTVEVDNGGDPPPIGIFEPCNQFGQNQGNMVQGYLYVVFWLMGNMGGWQQPQTYLALGGIQIGGSSERVRVWKNNVVGGASNGVTLGHLPDAIDIGPGNAQFRAQMEQLNHQALTTADVNLSAVNPELMRLIREYFLSTLYDIEIEDNEIKDMGLAGVGVICFFFQAEDQSEQLVIVENLLVRENHIIHCAQQIPGATRNSMLIGYGGVVLAELDEGEISDNEIRSCGKSYVEPVCGIYIRSGNNFDISRNEILDNGPEPELTLSGQGNQTANVRPGSRAGIFIALALKSYVQDMLEGRIKVDGRPAAFIHDNIVVQPLGQCLYMIGFGPVTCEGNSFTSQDQDIRNIPTFIAASVLIINLGISKDLMRIVAEPIMSQVGNQTTNNNGLDLVQANLIMGFLQFLPSGQVLFNDNQVTFDQRDFEVDISISSVAIATLDDISFVSNQLECAGLALVLNLTDQGPFIPLDYGITDGLLIGATLRTEANRFQEGFSGYLYSLISVAGANTTTGNQSSHCMLTYGGQQVFVNNIQNIVEQRDCDRRTDDFGRAGNLKKG